tara:strand:- start:1565 stop:1747 length:183 start_codon:yes stop_codon:yes gene_type:complete
MSSVIKSTEVKGQDLVVNLHNGNTYTYTGAGSEKAKLEAAPSQGTYFNGSIKGKYPFTKN